MTSSSSCCPARGTWSRLVIAGLTGMVGLTIATEPSSARGAREGKREEIIQSRQAGVPFLAVVSLSRQRVTLYDADGWIMRAPVSTGRTGYETPAGVYSILQKKVEHHSNLYDDASMPHMQRITWSGIALHAGALPGVPASHGCVRMPPGFAEQIFEVTKLGMRVVVMRDDMSPVTMSHPLLFKPGLVPAPELAKAVGPSTVALAPDAPSATPAQSLRALVAAKAAELQAATAKAQQARLAAARQNKEAAKAVKGLRMAQALKSKADAQLYRAEGLVETATSPEAGQRAADAKQEAASRQAEAQAVVDKLEADIQSIQTAAIQLRDEAQAAEQARQAAEEQSKEVARKLTPISVFISRKTQRLYVRQAREPLFDVPVTIANADEPLGTYVFSALAYTDGESDLRWNAVSLYNGDPTPAPAKAQRHGGSDAEAVSTSTAAAKSALDRIAIPKDAIDRIAEIISPGSSLIISDEEISRETGSGTDFIVVMSTDPQGGITIRRRRDPEVARDRDRDRFQRPFSRSPYAWGPSFW
jgi:L,D-transpeptidase catalytic domain